MKKLKLLPLLGAGLLALVGCSSGDGQEISRNQAKKMYESAQPAEMHLDIDDKWNGIEYFEYADPSDLDYKTRYPEISKKKNDASVATMVADLKSDEIFNGGLTLFHETVGHDMNDIVFLTVDTLMYDLATLFEEKPTYELTGKSVKEYFTGSTEYKINEKMYAFALYLETKFDANGYVSKTKFELVVGTDFKEDRSYGLFNRR